MVNRRVRQCRVWRFLENFFEENESARTGPLRGQRLRYCVAQGLVVGEKKARQAIFHHRSELAWRLARVERNHNRTLGHQPKIKSGPLHGIGREKRAALTRLESDLSNKRAHALDLIQQLSSGHADELLAAYFAQNHAAFGLPELGVNIFKKIGHERLACGGKRRGRIVAFGKLAQSAA